MADQAQESISTRFMRLNQLILGKSNYNLPKKYLIHRDGLLDILFALYEECNVDYLRKDKYIASFVDKFKDLMVELKSLRVNLRDFEVKKIIGRGHFGEVQVVREKATGDVYAMKVLRKQETLSQQNMAFYEEERDIMAKSTSPWLTKLQYAFQDNQNLYLIMEFHPGGDMLSLLEKYDNILPEEMCHFYLAELVLAIHSLHTMGYVHRDIKPDNILIDRTGHIKLADFGSSSKLNSHKLVISSMPVGTPDYVAPEVLTAMNAGPASSKSYGVECDWWSLGIVAYEMVFGSTPFTSDTVLITYNNIMNFKKSLTFPSEATEVSDVLIDLIKNLLEDPIERLGYDQLIVHPLFTDVDWNNIRHTAPPFVPTVSGVDDTSNFDDFEPEVRMFLVWENQNWTDNQGVFTDNSTFSQVVILETYTSERARKSEVPDIGKKLVPKLEKKNIQLEHELEIALAAKRMAETQVVALKDVIVQLETKMSEAEKEQLEASFQNADEKIANSIKKYENELSSKINIIAETQKKLLEQEESNAELKLKIKGLEKELQTYKDAKNRLEEKLKMFENNSVPKRKSMDSKLNQSIEKSPVWEKKLQSRNERQEKILLTSDLKQENEFLKTKIEILTSKVTKLREEAKSREDLEKLLTENENALSEAKLDLRVSVRKEQQSENLSSSLRERNKELREKLKATEDELSEKTKSEEDLQEHLKTLQRTVANVKEEIRQHEKSYEIEKAKLEERIKAMKDTWENSKDVNQKFAKTQGQYEEISKQNEILTKECDEKDKKVVELLQENKVLKNDIITKQNECIKYKQLSSVLKSTCAEMEEDLKDFEIIVESRENYISELNDKIETLGTEVRRLREELKNKYNGAQKEERQKEELLKHVNELTTELDNQNYLHEAEIQNLQDSISHYKKVVTELEDQIAQFQKEFSLQDKDAKGYSERIMTLESQLCEIKEEAARHITQISSLKASNLKLTQALDEALENQKENKKNIEDLYNEMESEKAKNLNEKVKLQETISQQIKLIDFLQSKTENMEKKKRPNISRLFGRKDNPIQAPPPRDVERLLETERSRCRRLQDQLSQARAEKMALQREINAISKSSSNSEVPVSPVSRAMHTAITASPYSHSETNSPVLSSKELLTKIIKPPGMKHKIPHRFTEIMCMRGTKCCACLDSVHFGRPLVKCQECSVTCHPKCASSVPSTCGLPSEFMQHFKSVVQDYASGDSSKVKDGKSEGWIKVPKSNKQGWDRKYLRVINNILYVFENADEMDLGKASCIFEFGSDEAKMVVTSAVSATELPFAATSDLPYVLKLESFPFTTCWPQRCLYIMTSSFNDKQMWVSVLENLAEKSLSEVDGIQKNKLIGKGIWTLKSNTLIDPLCTTIFDENVILLGAVEGLFILKIVNKFTCSLQEKLDGFSCVYQITCMNNIGVLVLIHDEDRKLSLTDLNAFESKVYGSLHQSIALKSVCDVKNCHLFAVEEMSSSDAPYICIATSNNVMLCMWDSASKKFYTKKIIEVNEPCSCILFTPKSILFGTDVFHELSLGSYSAKKFLDGSDASLAGLVYGASHFRSFPIAIFQVSACSQNKEYLLCFHEMGVFVNGNGQRTRPDDMKWSRLPLSFAYRSPYLFITHFNSLEVIEIPPQDIPEIGIRASMSVRNPQFMGIAHVEQSILISSSYNETVELMLVDGSSIGNSDFPVTSSDDGISATYTGTNSCSSGKESVGESEMVDLDFSFSTSMNQSLNQSEEESSISSKSSTESASSQS
ncbi:hypothetical protein NPIL_303761 [Nephila pilipes]|uniref:non-specific serine/threonine protein kinase n=1 Tax=Nephila pilipes TaxID=299642 RepID=A0A8X6N957_NEPPI|nr:hypothetical protein NPIL_303761 [Nephila pilipes]